MTKPSTRSRSSEMQASADLIQAARVVQNAAESLAQDSFDQDETARLLMVARRLEAALRRPSVQRGNLVEASPSLLERSGRTRSLVEMIEAEPGDDSERFRLAKLLFRALLWTHESFPMPQRPSSRSRRLRASARSEM